MISSVLILPTEKPTIPSYMMYLIMTGISFRVHLFLKSMVYSMNQRNSATDTVIRKVKTLDRMSAVHG